MRRVRTIASLLGLVLLALMAHAAGREAQQGATAAADNPPAPVQLTAERDHQRMMDLLHITAIRRGADGDPKSRLRGCSWPFRNPASIPGNPWGKHLRTIRRTCSAKCHT